MMRRLSLWTLACCLVVIIDCGINAQPYHDNIWIFSDLNGTSIADFSSGNVRIDSIDTDLILEGASSSICDTEGNLAFYTNGCRIYNWQHRLMENGEGINPGEIYDDYCNTFDAFPVGYPGIPQSSSIIPWPDREDEYLLFHTRSVYNNDISDPSNINIDRLYVTIINMNANDGEGMVTQKNVELDTTFREPKIILTRHANGVDWWLLNPEADNDIYNIYLIDSTGVSSHHEQATGLIDNYSNIGTDQLVFNPTGDKLIRFSIELGLSLHDFDRTTGELSNFQLVDFPQGGPEVFGFSGTAVSPSGQFVYVTKVTEVYQYDLWADDITASQLLIAELVDDGAMLLPPTVQNMQLGPDCKIYAYMVNGDRHHIIHNPDERGDACDWEQGGLLLGRYVFRDQPIFPNFRLGPLGDEGSPCASPIVSIGEPEAEQSAIARVFPNPVGPELSYSVQDVGVLRTEFFDGLGRLVIANPDRLTAGAIGKLALGGVPSGPYVLRLYLADGRVVVRKVVVR